MIPKLFTGSTEIAIGAPLLTSGYVPDEVPAAQHWNWILAHLTAEFFNVLDEQGITPDAAVDNQLLAAFQGIADDTVAAAPDPQSFGTSQTPAALDRSTFWTVTAAGATAQDFSAGATHVGVRLVVYNSGTGICTISFAAGATFDVTLSQYEKAEALWDGAAWGLMQVVKSIGDWNMDANANLTVAHGFGASYKKFRSISGIIRRDQDDGGYPIPYINVSAQSIECAFANFDTTNIFLVRKTGGIFDSTDYDSTSYNRGWLTFGF